MNFWNVEARSLKPELMDDLGLDRDRYGRALRGLARMNWVSSAARPIFNSISKCVEPKKKLKILDLATGAGDLPTTLAEKGRRSGFDFEVHGCDFNSQAVNYAQKKAAEKSEAIQFFQLDVKREKIPAGFDVLTNSLFLHHLTKEETIGFMMNLKSAKPRMIVITDLIRSRRGLLMAYVATRMFSRSSIIHHDGPQSVRAAYTIPEILELSASAGLQPVFVKKIWPERFLLTWKN